MKQDSMPVEQDGMALAAKAPVLETEDTPKVDESAPAEETLESPVVEATAEGGTQEVGTPQEESPAAEVDRDRADVDQALAAPAPVEAEEALATPAQAQEKANFFSKVWGILIAKSEITVPILLVFSLVMGLMIGYSVMGDGPVRDVFQPETWTHVWKLIFG